MLYGAEKLWTTKVDFSIGALSFRFRIKEYHKLLD